MHKLLAQFTIAANSIGHGICSLHPTDLNGYLVDCDRKPLHRCLAHIEQGYKNWLFILGIQFQLTGEIGRIGANAPSHVDSGFRSGGEYLSPRKEGPRAGLRLLTTATATWLRVRVSVSFGIRLDCCIMSCILAREESPIVRGNPPSPAGSYGQLTNAIAPI